MDYEAHSAYSILHSALIYLNIPPLGGKGLMHVFTEKILDFTLNYFTFLSKAG